MSSNLTALAGLWRSALAADSTLFTSARSVAFVVAALCSLLGALSTLCPALERGEALSQGSLSGAPQERAQGGPLGCGSLALPGASSLRRYPPQEGQGRRDLGALWRGHFAWSLSVGPCQALSASAVLHRGRGLGRTLRRRGRPRERPFNAALLGRRLVTPLPQRPGHHRSSRGAPHQRASGRVGRALPNCAIPRPGGPRAPPRPSFLRLSILTPLFGALPYRSPDFQSYALLTKGTFI